MTEKVGPLTTKMAEIEDWRKESDQFKEQSEVEKEVIIIDTLLSETHESREN